jgi:hypothetical protein
MTKNGTKKTNWRDKAVADFTWKAVEGVARIKERQRRVEEIRKKLPPEKGLSAHVRKISVRTWSSWRQKPSSWRNK